MRLIPNVSTICWILQELSYNVFISVVLKWETPGFEYLLQVSLQQAMT